MSTQIVSQITDEPGDDERWPADVAADVDARLAARNARIDALPKPVRTPCQFAWCEGHDQWEVDRATGRAFRAHSIPGEDFWKSDGTPYLIGAYAVLDETKPGDPTPEVLGIHVDVAEGMSHVDARKLAGILLALADKLEAAL